MLESSMKTRGDRILECNDHHPSIIEVPSSIPAFVGYTEKTACDGASFLYTPIRISSMAQFRSIFGEAPQPVYSLTNARVGEQADLECCGKAFMTRRSSIPFMLYYQMMMFYANGGETCYVVTVGDYSVERMAPADLIKGIEALTQERIATLLICPEAIALDSKELCYEVQAAMLYHCGHKMMNRVAILDVYNGDRPRSNPEGDPVNRFRNYIGYSWLDYAAAYYPWVNASVVSDGYVSWVNIDPDSLNTILKLEKTQMPNERKLQIDECLAAINANPDRGERHNLHLKLLELSGIYPAILKNIVFKLNVLPPSAAMAGLYTLTDRERGVWKAPANVALNAVVSATSNLSHDEQEDLNLPLTGKPLNAIRCFYGRGVLVWGARTLNGNSIDWKYIHIKRTTIMIEESVRQAIVPLLNYFNCADLWVTLKRMINEYLTTLWKKGALSGLVADDAFKVFVGLGETMTADDICNGLLKVYIYVALIKPAEFVEIAIEQKMIEQNACG